MPHECGLGDRVESEDTQCCTGNCDERVWELATDPEIDEQLCTNGVNTKKYHPLTTCTHSTIKKEPETYSHTKKSDAAQEKMRCV